MAALSDYLEAQLLNHIFRSGVFTKPSQIAIALTSGVCLDSNTGNTIPELPSGVQKGNNFVTTNYARINLGSPSGVGNNVWNAVGSDETTIFSVSGVSSSGQAVGTSGYFYPLYLNQTTSNNADKANTSLLIGFSYSYQFKEFPNVTFYSPTSLAQSGQAQNPGYSQYDGNGFIKNSSQLVFNTALNDWGWVSGIAILDNSAYGSGNLLMYSKLENPRYIYTGDNVKLDTNSLEISLK
jgi:hypothetical protein